MRPVEDSVLVNVTDDDERFNARAAQSCETGGRLGGENEKHATTLTHRRSRQTT
jgi:hypothetical protein